MSTKQINSSSTPAETPKQDDSKAIDPVLATADKRKTKKPSYGVTPSGNVLGTGAPTSDAAAADKSSALKQKTEGIVGKKIDGKLIVNEILLIKHEAGASRGENIGLHAQEDAKVRDIDIQVVPPEQQLGIQSVSEVGAKFDKNLVGKNANVKVTGGDAKRMTGVHTKGDVNLDTLTIELRAVQDAGPITRNDETRGDSKYRCTVL